MSDLRIGKIGRRVFRLPVDVAGEAIAVLAKRGAGKTNTAAVITEELFGAGVQVVILDPVGAWWGIRSGADGESPGLSIPILGGQHGDVPLEETAGKLIADVAVETRSSLLLDLSDFPSKAAIRRFVADFAERLYRRKARQASLLHLVLEEADEFAPQSRVRGDERMLGAIEQIVRRARSRGIGITMVSQRSAKLHKDVLTQADVLVAMRTTGPHDRKAIKEWVSVHADDEVDVVGTLHELETGEAWFWNPERDLLQRVRVRLRETFDSSSTPKAGQRRSEPTAPAAIDLDSLGEQIQETAEKAKANDPKALKRELAAARAEIRKLKAETPAPDPEAIAAAERRGRAQALRGIDETRKTVRSHTAQIVDAARKIEQQTTALYELTEETWGEQEIGGGASSGRQRSGTTPPPRPPRRRRGAESGAARPAPKDIEDLSLSKAQQKILDALATYEALGISEVERAAAGAVAGYKATGGYFTNTVSSLHTLELLSYPRNGNLALTERGREQATPRNFLSLEDIHGAWLDLTKGGAQRKILEVLLAAYPDAMSRDELAERAGYDASGGYFTNMVSALRTLGAVDYPEPGFVAASELLFPEGLS